MVNNPSASEGATTNVSFIPGSGRSPGGGNDNPLQCSCWDNPRKRGAWQATVQGVAKSQQVSTSNCPSAGSRHIAYWVPDAAQSRASEPQHHLLKRLYFYLCQRLIDHRCVDLFLDFIWFCWSICLFLYQYHTVLITVTL